MSACNWAQLTGGHFEGFKLETDFNIDLRSADLTNADFKRASLFGDTLDFSYANLQGADFASAQLRATNDINIAVADLTDATFRSASLSARDTLVISYSDLTNADFDDALIAAGDKILFSSYYSDGASFSGASLLAGDEVKGGDSGALRPSSGDCRQGDCLPRVAPSHPCAGDGRSAARRSTSCRARSSGYFRQVFLL